MLPKWMTSIISFLDNFLCISVMSSSSLHITFAKSKQGRWLWGVGRDDTSLRVTLGISSVWSFFLLFFLGTPGSGERVGKSYVKSGVGVRISEVELSEDRWDTVGEDAVSWSVEIVDLPLSPHSESDPSSIAISWWEDNMSFKIKFHPQQMHKKEYTPKSVHHLSQMLTPEEWVTVAKVRIVELLALYIGRDTHHHMATKHQRVLLLQLHGFSQHSLFGCIESQLEVYVYECWNKWKILMECGQTLIFAVTEMEILVFTRDNKCRRWLHFTKTLLHETLTFKKRNEQNFVNPNLHVT